jgi:hypothetical protein
VDAIATRPLTSSTTHRSCNGYLDHPFENRHVETEGPAPLGGG